MAETISAGWENARQIVKEWLTVHNRSSRGLAQEAGIQPSIISRFLNEQTTLNTGTAIKLYEILHRDMSALDKRAFIEATGLMPLVSIVSRDALFTAGLPSFDPTVTDPYKIGTLFMAGGNYLAGASLWDEAISWFQTVEDRLGRSSSVAARAACNTALMYAELGNYDLAQEALIRAQQHYRSAIDPETETIIYRVRGWVNYYQGDFGQAEKWFKNCLRIAKEYGSERLGETAEHFLGRVYFDWGRSSSNKEQTERLLLQAEIQLDRAHQIHLACKFSDSYRAFDLFRKAQLLQAQDKWREARRLRDISRQMFNREIHELHIDLEEARLALEIGEIRTPGLKAEEALNGWAQHKKASGMAEALRVLGDLEYIQGNAEQALEPYIAALCIYPYENHLDNRQLWLKITDLYGDIARSKGQKACQKLEQNLQEQVDSRQGYFSYLNHVTADRTAEITHVLDRLSFGNQSSRFNSPP